MNKDISVELTTTMNKLLQTICSFPAEKFNSGPFEGSWTAAQVSDHLLKSISGVHELLYSPAKPSTRMPGQKESAIKTMFLDFSTKMKSPEFVLPRNEPLQKQELLAALETLKAQLTEAMKTLDLSASCSVFELPGFGEFTREEWIWFAIYHTQRHTQQLSNIYEMLVDKKQVAV